jgi:hypothetical protein
MTLEEEGARRRAEQQTLKQPRAQLLDPPAMPQAGWDGAARGQTPGEEGLQLLGQTPLPQI